MAEENNVTVNEEERSFKDWWNERKVVKWFKEHPDASLTLLGGALSIIGAVAKIAAANKEYEDSVYLTASDDSVYKLPAKEMKTIKRSKVTDAKSVD